MVQKSIILKILNLLLFIVFIFQIATGLGHEYIGHDLFEIIHYYGGILLTICVIVHVLFNWSWVRNNYFKKLKR